MINLLAEFAVDSLICLRELKLIDASILKIIPLNGSGFKVKDIDQISFEPIFRAIKNKMFTEELFPTKRGYVSCENAYWADALHLMPIFSDSQLAQLFTNPKVSWVFTTINRNNADSVVKLYFIAVKSLTEDQIID
ncbi:MAG: hypothetical protein IJS29_07565 [Selenomonadaceae bacterium]|nr:hypothetical protein [Selenomonadaceae bacterium]MBQ7199104.1 hypothetical protein [Selenomonadaceae bacterium]